MKIHNTRDAIRKGIALLPEDRKKQGLVLKHDVAKNITIANLEKNSGKMGILKKNREEQQAAKYISMLKISVPDPQKAVSVSYTHLDVYKRQS